MMVKWVDTEPRLTADERYALEEERRMSPWAWVVTSWLIVAGAGATLLTLVIV